MIQKSDVLEHRGATWISVESRSFTRDTHMNRQCFQKIGINNVVNSETLGKKCKNLKYTGRKKTRKKTSRSFPTLMNLHFIIQPTSQTSYTEMSC